MRRILSVLVAVAAVAVAAGGPARAAGGDVAFDGGSARQQAQVRAALAASAFDWSLLPQRVTVHIAAGSDSYAAPGEVWLDADLLDAGRFAWTTVQHELAHQVDFLVLDDAQRARLGALLGSGTWCGADGAEHEAYGCERFAETLVAAYWPSRDDTAHAYASRAAFRATLDGMLGGSRTLASAKPRTHRR